MYPDCHNQSRLSYPRCHVGRAKDMRHMVMVTIEAISQTAVHEENFMR